MNIKCDQCGRFTPDTKSNCLACGAYLFIDVKPQTRDAEIAPFDNSDGAYIARLNSQGYPSKYFLEAKNKPTEELKKTFQSRRLTITKKMPLADKWRQNMSILCKLGFHRIKEKGIFSFQTGIFGWVLGHLKFKMFECEKCSRDGFYMRKNHKYFSFFVPESFEQSDDGNILIVIGRDSKRLIEIRYGVNNPRPLIRRYKNSNAVADFQQKNYPISKNARVKKSMMR